MNHPKLSILVQKLKSYIKLKICDYYEYVNKNINMNSGYYINKNKFIFEKLKNFINKYQLIYENDVQFEQIKQLYDKNEIEIYEILVYLWVDIISDDEDEDEDEELTKIYNNIIEKIKDEKDIKELNREKKLKNENNYIDIMTNNLTNEITESKKNEKFLEDLQDTEKEENSENEDDNLSYYILNIEDEQKKNIIIKKNFLRWQDNSCRFDSFIFLYNYGILPLLSDKNLNLNNNNFFNFVNGLITEYEKNSFISFWDYYETFGKDFLDIKKNDKEWKVQNTISSFVSKLSNIEIFKTKYLYKTGKKCRHNLRKNCKGEFLFPIILSINRLNDYLNDLEDIIHDKLITPFEKCNIPKCEEKYRYEFIQTCEFLFIILDYLYKDLNNNKNINVKKKLIRYNISCFSEFYEIIGFIVMPKSDHFTSILMGNINDNNEYEYYYYNDMEEGIILKRTDTFENILKNYKIHLILYKHLK